MRTTLMALGLVLCLQVPLQAQEAEARAIIDKAMKAQGDEKAAKKMAVATLKAKGVFHIMDMALDMTLKAWVHEPDKEKVVISLTAPGVKLDIIEVINGDKGWVSLDGNVAELEEADLKEAKEMRHVERVINLYGIKADKDMKVQQLGESKEGDKTLFGVKVSKKGNRDVSLYFDKASFLLAKAAYRAQDPVTKEEVNEEKFFDNYKEFVPGYKYGSKIIVKHDGQLFMDMDLTEITPVEKHDAGIFAMPK
jgi:hypothetical protein